MSDVPGRQIVGRSGRARYELPNREAFGEPDYCRSCDSDIVMVDGVWAAVEGNYPNLAHCYRSAGNGKGMPHVPAACPKDEPLPGGIAGGVIDGTYDTPWG